MRTHRLSVHIAVYYAFGCTLVKTDFSIGDRSFPVAGANVGKEFPPEHFSTFPINIQISAKNSLVNVFLL
jgi:hypothetical protein